MSKSVFNSLQVFRGLAAFAVVVHHAGASTAAFVGDLPSIAESFFSLGYLGVDFFFVLSGFIIMYSHMDDERNLSSVRRYLSKRLLRIFPPYIPISLVLLFLYSIMPDFSSSDGREYSIVSSLFLVPADNPPALSVAWTLVHEMLFYTVFLLFFVSLRLFIVALILWACVMLFGFYHSHGNWLRYLLSPLNIEFMLGVLSAFIIKKAAYRHNPILLVVVGISLAITMLLLMYDEPATILRIGFAFGLAVLIVGFVIIEQIAVLPWPNVLLIMGNASYSIYLVHSPLLSITQRLSGYLNLEWVSAMLFGITMCLLAGYYYYMFIERPMIFLIRSRLMAR